MAEAIFWFSFAAMLALTLRAPFSRSWPLLWFAALVSYIASILSMFSIGIFVFLLTCLQLAAVVAIRLQLGPGGWALVVLIGLLTWVLLVPVQIVGTDFLGGIGAYQIVGLAGLLLVLLPLPDLRSLIVGRAASNGGPASSLR